jgi:hypothetical protein
MITSLWLPNRSRLKIVLGALADGCAAAGRSSCFSLSVNAFPGQQWRIGFAPLNLMAGEKAVNDEVRDLYIYSF